LDAGRANGKPASVEYGQAGYARALPLPIRRVMTAECWASSSERKQWLSIRGGFGMYYDHFGEGIMIP